ncbi:MAG TPA: 3'(2'),5'-bisphosphate nucleotidase CysQ [Terriglobales bacterium]|jgi:myo-inositol-1(or 4)-monophosphatase|nr:3'(2'),5'-bisphosphate nucleotidase CysQ [Terriglobales bacterium]
MADSEDILLRIRAALSAAREVFQDFTPGKVAAEYKAGLDPVTLADTAVDSVLRRALQRDGEGWLSEETPDDFARLEQRRLWVVDPLDGTREFVEGVPEFCVSIGLVEDGRPVAGGILNPVTDELFLGSAAGVTYNGKPAQISQRNSLAGATVLASRSETKRGEWKLFEVAEFIVKPMGSVAYKLALVSAGLADATFTLTPKHEWDVAGGVALVESAGGAALTLDGAALRFNNRSILLSGLVACGPFLREPLMRLVGGKLSF